MDANEKEINKDRDAKRCTTHSLPYNRVVYFLETRCLHLLLGIKDNKIILWMQRKENTVFTQF